MRDALNCEIEIGKIYGYSVNRNGLTRVTIGMVNRITKKRVVLDVLKISESLNGEQLMLLYDSARFIRIPKTAKVYGNRLFPVNRKLLT